MAYGNQPSKSERARYNEHRERTGKELGMDKHAYNYLRRIGQRLSKADTNYANGTTGGEPKYRGNEITNRYEEKHHTKDVNEAFKKAGEYRKKKGLKVHFYHQQDPRGAALHASKERLSQKDYNSKGHVIY